MFRNEPRSKPRGLADLLLPFALIDDGVLLQQDGSLVAAWKYSGPDMMAATASGMSVLSAQFNRALCLGDGWIVSCDAIRSHAPGYPEQGAFPNPITSLIDAERREQFLTEGAHFESEYFLALTWLPPLEHEERARGWFFEGQGKHSSAHAASRALKRFREAIDTFENVFGHLFRSERLQRVVRKDEQGFSCVEDNLLRYLRRCITGEDHPFALPDIPVDLNDLLAVEDFHGGLEPRIGNKHIGIVAIDGFPKASYPGILAALDTLPIEYRWNTRAILLDPLQAVAMLNKARKKWKSKVRGFKDQVMDTANGAMNGHAAMLAADAETAMTEAASGDVQFAQYTSTIICLDPDPVQLHENTRLIQKTIQNLGFGCRIETINAVEAWRGSLPGDGYSNVRRVLLHTLNLADMLPITSVWPGLRENPSALMPKNSPPLLFAATTGTTPFRLNLHVSDLGHTVMLGPSGAGKSTALALIVAQWFRYPNAQVFSFDKGYSIWALCAAAGGEFYDLAGPKTKLAFCPLQKIDENSDFQWAVNWIEVLCELNGLKFLPRHKNAAAEAMQRLRSSPNRTLTEFSANVQDMDIREALQHYTISGPMGALLDAEFDELDCRGSNPFLCFETQHLMQLDQKAQIPVLLYLFRRIEQRLDGRPTLITLDEAWASLRHPVFVNQLRDWLKTLRRLNGVVLLATQQISDIAKSDIADVVIEQCPTKILLPNDAARTTGTPEHPGPRDFYERLGLNTRELDIVETSTAKRHYYVISPLGRRLIELRLGKVALSFVGINGKEERTQLENVMRQYPQNWREQWLHLRGLPAWANYLRTLQQTQTEQEESILCQIA